MKYNNITFGLTEAFLNKYKRKQPDWGPLGYFTFKRTYARQLSNGKTEEWWQTCQRVVEGCFLSQKIHCKKSNVMWNERQAQRSAQEMFKLIFDFKFLPPGRGLWSMGTEFAFEKGGACLNNPLHIDTKILTKEYGWIKLRGLKNGENIHVLTSTKKYSDNNDINAKAIWAKAVVSPIEHHPTYILTFKDKGGFITEVKSSENHRWFRRKTTKTNWERVNTTELKIGDYFPIVKPTKLFKPCKTGYQHGFFFGDGTRSNGELHQFSDSIEVLINLFNKDVQYIDKTHAVVRQCPLAWGNLPEENYKQDRRYLWSFLAGYFAADGHLTAHKAYIDSARLDEIKEVSRLFKDLGIRCTDPYISIKKGTSNNFYPEGRPSNLYRISIELYDLKEEFFLKEKHRKQFAKTHTKNRRRDYYRLINIKKTNELEPVQCVTVPNYEQFVIDGFLLTSNCGFVSTKDIDKDFSAPFVWLMDMSLLGVGVGFDTEGKYADVFLKQPRVTPEIWQVEDSREGWVETFRRVLDAYSGRDSLPQDFDYSLIRPAGSPIKRFGGIAPGPNPLIKLVERTTKLLDKYVEADHPVDSTLIVDLMNFAGAAVVAGGIRRTAEIAFGTTDDEEFKHLKDPDSVKNTELARWASNNSFMVEIGEDYTELAQQSAVNGEPGYFWLDNARRYGRMSDGKNDRDRRAMGCNPCGEQTLEDRELCNLVETFPAKHNTLDEYLRTLKLAYLYAKTVTLISTHDPRTNAVMLRNRRIGLSQTGIVENINKIGFREHINWCEKGYQEVQMWDQIYSDWLCIPRSIKTTTIKPSGTVSLLPGSTPGIHFPHSKYYIRRIQVSKNSHLWEVMQEAGYHVEKSVYADDTMVVEFPVYEPHFDRRKDQISLWEQFELAAALQAKWADNQVSITITVKPEEAQDLPRALSMYEKRLKAVSFLPLTDHKYEQAPYEEITQEQYEEKMEQIKKVKINLDPDEQEIDKFCDGDACEIPKRNN